jgi:hypothetical protein
MSDQHPGPVELDRGRFRPPPSPRNDPLDPAATLSLPSGAEPSGAELHEPSGPPAAPDSSGTSPPSERHVTAAALAKTLAGGLLIVCAGVSLLLRSRNRDLRRPTRGELHEMTAPTARILLRHTDVAMEAGLLADLADGCAAANALVEYLETDPIRRRTAPEPPPPEPEPSLEDEWSTQT